MSPDLAVVLVAIIGIIVPVLTLLIKFVQDRGIAKDAADARKAIATASASAAVAVERVRPDLAAQGAAATERLSEIHTLVNSRLTRVLDLLTQSHALLKLIAPNDPRVIALTKVDPEPGKLGGTS